MRGGEWRGGEELGHDAARDKNAVRTWRGDFSSDSLTRAMIRRTRR
jgi:hypothetical protein